ncbi:MAG: hypothetical protein ABIJ15_00760 [bacterium]
MRLHIVVLFSIIVLSLTAPVYADNKNEINLNLECSSYAGTSRNINYSYRSGKLPLKYQIESFTFPNKRVIRSVLSGRISLDMKYFELGYGYNCDKFSTGRNGILRIGSKNAWALVLKGFYNVEEQFLIGEKRRYNTSAYMDMLIVFGNLIYLNFDLNMVGMHVTDEVIDEDGACRDTIKEESDFISDAEFSLKIKLFPRRKISYFVGIGGISNENIHYGENTEDYCFVGYFEILNQINKNIHWNISFKCGNGEKSYRTGEFEPSTNSSQKMIGLFTSVSYKL